MVNSKKTYGVKIVVIGLVSLLLVCQGALYSSSEEGAKRWHWFSALSLKNDWRILKGQADVVFRDGIFKAELYDLGGFHRMTVSGSVKNNMVKAVATRHGTDDDPRKLTGRLTRFEFGRTSVLLCEEYAGGLVIGITLD